jgi:hypothetical protein
LGRSESAGVIDPLNRYRYDFASRTARHRGASLTPEEGCMSEQLTLDLCTLRFVESSEHFSTYEERTATGGHLVYLAHGTGRRLVPFDDLISDLHTTWSQFVISTPGRAPDPNAFLALLRDMTTEPVYVDEEIRWCDDCEQPHHQDELYYTNQHDAASVCEPCRDDWYYCADCEESFRSTHTVGPGAETEVCIWCRNQNWTFCGDCGCYRHDEDEDHFHDDDDEACDQDCESPAQAFRIRNDGEEPLWNDTRTTVGLPAGVISAEGIMAIRNVLHEYCYRSAMNEDGIYNYTLSDQERRAFDRMMWKIDELGERWQTKEGNYTKRLSRFAYKLGVKIPPDLISAIGNIGREHSAGKDYHVEVTRDLNLRPARTSYHDKLVLVDGASSPAAAR